MVHGKIKINTHSKTVKPNSVHEVTETLMAPLTSCWEVLSSWLFLAQFLHSRQLEKRSARHQSSAENSLVVAHCTQNNFCFWWSRLHQCLLAHLFSFLVLSPKSEALPISSDSWYPLLLFSSVVCASSLPSPAYPAVANPLRCYPTVIYPAECVILYHQLQPLSPNRF